MTYNQSFWEFPMQFFKQLPHGSLLLRRSGIIRNTIVIQPTFVTNPDRVVVVWVTVSTYLYNRSSKLNGSIPAHYIMIADAFPSPLLMPQVDVRSTAPLPRTDSRAMNHYKRNSSHFCGTYNPLTHDVAPNAVKIAARRLIRV